MSASASQLRVERKPGGYAVVTLCKEPVNSLDTRLWTDLAAAIAALEADPAVQGVVIASGLQRDVFTAGNDLAELYAPGTSRERYARFWAAQNEFLAALYSTRLATVAAVRGACPAGGCIISLCCDARVMTAHGTIGLNEVLLGIPVPKMWAQVMAQRIGQGPAEKLLLAGKLASPQVNTPCCRRSALLPCLVCRLRCAIERTMPAVHAGTPPSRALPRSSLLHTLVNHALFPQPGRRQALFPVLVHYAPARNTHPPRLLPTETSHQTTNHPSPVSLSSQEALALGLVDQLVPDNASLMPAAEAALKPLMCPPGHALHATKRNLRADFCDQWRAFHAQEAAGAWEFLNQPATLKALKGTMDRLSGGKPGGKPAAKL